MSEIINYTRLTTSDKISDKFVTCQAYIPQDRDQSEKGQIFSHIEILSPWFPTSQIGQTIINTLIKEYYKGNDSSELVNFEEAIKKVNEVLARAAQNGETEWIGKMSGVLVLVNKSEIHFAQTGKSHSYLYRTGKVNHITEGLENEEAPHPLKTFSNLTSGTLLEDDRIIIANDAFFEVINPNELKLIISSLPPALAAIESGKILQNHGTQDANAIFLELTTKEKLADLPPEQKIEAVYLDQQILTLSAISKNALFNIGQSIGKIFKSSSGKIAYFSKNKVAPLAKKGIDFSREKSAIALQRTKQITKTDSKIDEIEPEEVPREDVTQRRSNYLGNIKENLITLLLKAKNKIRRFLIHIGIYTRKKSKMYFGLLIAVVIILSVVIFLSLRHKKASENLATWQNQYNQIVALSGQADILMSRSNQDATDKYNQVLELYQGLKGTKFYDQAKPLADKASSQIDAVSKLTHIDAKSQIEIKNSNSITLSSKSMLALNGVDLYSRNLTANSFNKIASLGVEANNLTNVPDLNLISALANNKITVFDPSGNNLQSTSFTFNKPNNLKAFGSNLYVSDISDNQLYKVTYSDNTFSDKSAYFKESTDIIGLADYAIDGSIYTLSTKGLITRYSRGNKINEFQTTLPTNQKIDAYEGILTSESSTNLIIVTKINSSYRLIEMRKSGDFIKQYELNNIGELRDAVSDPTNSSIYVLSKDKVLEFEID